MPKTIVIPEKKIVVFDFDELEPTIQKKVIGMFWDINIEYEWWEPTYEGAKELGIDIHEFDLERGNYCNGEFIDVNHHVNNGKLTAELIVKELGDGCELFKLATEFLSAYDNVMTKEEDDKIEDLIAEFKEKIFETYKIILKQEYDYLASKEAIIETINSNEYQFLVNGSKFTKE